LLVDGTAYPLDSQVITDNYSGTFSQNVTHVVYGGAVFSETIIETDFYEFILAHNKWLALQFDDGTYGTDAYRYQCYIAHATNALLLNPILETGSMIFSVKYRPIGAARNGELLFDLKDQRFAYLSLPDGFRTAASLDDHDPNDLVHFLGITRASYPK
jgi:hypothetical protein